EVVGLLSHHYVFNRGGWTSLWHSPENDRWAIRGSHRRTVEGVRCTCRAGADVSRTGQRFTPPAKPGCSDGGNPRRRYVVPLSASEPVCCRRREGRRLHREWPTKVGCASLARHRLDNRRALPRNQGATGTIRETGSARSRDASGVPVRIWYRNGFSCGRGR